VTAGRSRFLRPSSIATAATTAPTIPPKRRSSILDSSFHRADDGGTQRSTAKADNRTDRIELHRGTKASTNGKREKSDSCAFQSITGVPLHRWLEGLGHAPCSYRGKDTNSDEVGVE
jgi:hypothetical protein